MGEGSRRSEAPAILFTSGDPFPVDTVNPDGKSLFLLVGDHAGRLIPASLGTLGLGQDDLSRHIGWDIGVGRLGEMLAEKLDAVFVRQRYSRLVVDCNRDPDRADAVPPVSDGTPVPGNEGLSVTQRAARIAAIHEPYHRAISDQLDLRESEGRETILVSLHSFTPSLRMTGISRPWQIGVLHEGGDATFAMRLLQALRTRNNLVVGENEPYAMTGIDYTVPRHAYARGLRYAELEIRQDLLGEEVDLFWWNELLSTYLEDAQRQSDDDSLAR